jgi:cob(I)alamin adenosyltransferase
VVLSLKNSESIPEYILIYLNRLSDYLFTLARAIAADKNIIEIIWKPQLDK